MDMAMLSRAFLLLALAGVTTCSISQPPCRVDEDCNLLGTCQGGVCLCDDGFTGKDCGLLDLHPVPVTPAFRPANVSAWGGTSVKGSDGLWHLAVAELSHSCGVDAWTVNGQLRHAVSRDAWGPFEPLGLLRRRFSYNPQFVQGKVPPGTPRYLLYHIGCAGGLHPPIQGCSRGSSIGSDIGHCQNSCSEVTATCSSGLATVDVSIAYTEELSANASNSLQALTGLLRAPAQLLNGSNPDFPRADHASCEDSTHSFVEGGTKHPFPCAFNDNPSAVVLPNGSVVMLFRTRNHTHGSIGLATAQSWKGPYKMHPFPYNGAEDPFIWQNSRGFHALFHGGAPDGDGHAFSRDGLHWHLSPHAAVPVVSVPGKRSDLAPPGVLRYTDGSVVEGAHGDRPGLAFDETGKPVAFFTVVSGAVKGSDASWLIAAPVRHRSMTPLHV